MLKLIDYMRLRRAGFSVKVSWRTSRAFNVCDKALLLTWFAYLLYALIVFILAINVTLIRNIETALAHTQLSFHALQSDNSKLERGVIALLNGRPVKVIDAYYVFSKKEDSSLIERH